jgi:hypothetical protein
MKLENKYIKCFSIKKKNQLLDAGYKYLYMNNGTYYFENNQNLTIKFSDSDILKDTKFSMWIGL